MKQRTAPSPRRATCLAWVALGAALTAVSAAAAPIEFTLTVDGQTRTATVESYRRDGVSYVPLGPLLRQWGGDLNIGATGVQIEFDRKAALINSEETLVSATLGQFELSRPLIESSREAWIAVDDVEPLFTRAFGATPTVSQGPEDGRDAAVAPTIPGAPPVADEPPLPENLDALAMPVVIIDPGHGGEDSGVAGTSMTEDDYALALALRLQQALRSKGLEAELTRTDDTSLGLIDRVNTAISKRGGLFVSIHAGASYAAGASGVDIFYPADPGRAVPGAGRADTVRGNWGGFTQRSRQLAEDVARAVSAGTAATTSTVRPIRSPLLERVQMPGILVEAGYLTNPADEAEWASETRQDLLAAALAEGIGRFLAPTAPSGYAAEEPVE